ncbi:MAG: VWA domain-containing protein [Candidatus Kapaibacterium sp.]
MKIRFIREIRVPFPFSGLMLLVPSLFFAQPKHVPQITLQTGKYSLSVSVIASDSAYLRVRTQNGHAVKKLTSDDFLITRDDDTAEIISCTALTRSSTSDLAVSFILDNSSSMYHSYDSLTKYLDVFLDSLGIGLTVNVMAFDNVERKRSYDGTNHTELFIASSEFTEDKSTIKEFWHSYDSIRTDFTPLYETIIKGLERIIDRRKAGDSLRSEIMIVVTDGADNASSVNIEKLSELISVMPVTLFTVNFKSDPDGRLLWLAKKSRGDHYVAADLHGLQKTLEYLRKDISYSYKLVFRFPFRGAGGMH